MLPVNTADVKSGPDDVMLTKNKHAQSPPGQDRVVDIPRISQNFLSLLYLHPILETKILLLVKEYCQGE